MSSTSHFNPILLERNFCNVIKKKKFLGQVFSLFFFITLQKLRKHKVGLKWDADDIQQIFCYAI